MERRIVRIPLPVPLIREMDAIVDRRLGGYESRGEFVREAIEAMALELLHGVVPDRVPNGSAAEDGITGPSPTGAGTANPFAATALTAPGSGVLVENGEAKVVDGPLFGLHNRDYPSLWTAGELARLTQAELIPVAEFLRAIADAAWRLGDQLTELEGVTGQKVTALFPTNRAKPESSEGAFLNFAVGSFSTDPTDGSLLGTGPLFTWRLAQLVRRDGEVLIGLTTDGFDLLNDIAGLTVDAPHPTEYATRFFHHLRTHSPRDWTSLQEVLSAIGEGLTRVELVERISQAHPTWTETVAATNTAGYVARGREWGLISPKLADRRYLLTEFGRAQLTLGEGEQ